jgi:hypothetical protein
VTSYRTVFVGCWTAAPTPARRAAYRQWQEGTQELLAERRRWIERHISRGQDLGVDRSDGLEL